MPPPAGWLDEAHVRVLTALCERLIPAGDGMAGATEAGVAAYIDGLLGAFQTDPPRIWAAAEPSSAGGPVVSQSRFEALSPLEELAWRTRIEGSLGRPEREVNGPVIGWQQQYLDGLAALGPDFADVDSGEQEARMAAIPEFVALVYGHACEGMYADPAYGGNAGGVGWRNIGFPGDAQPRGYTDAEVSGP